MALNSAGMQSTIAIVLLVLISAQGSAGDDPCRPTCPSYRVTKYFPDKRDCNKFWQCDHGEPVHKQCGPGLYFNPTLWVCEWPYMVDCTAKANATCTGSSTTAEPHTTAHPATSSTVLPTNSTTPFPTNSTTAYPINSTTVHPTYSTSFPTNSTTAFPANSTTAFPTNSTTTKIPDITTTLTPSTTTPIDPCRPTCPSSRVAKYFPDKRNCTKFWQCDNGEAVHMQCPSGLYFNPNLWVCDYPYRAGCTAKANATCTGGSTTAKPVTTTAHPINVTTTLPSNSTTKFPTTSTTAYPTTSTPITTKKTTTHSTHITTRSPTTIHHHTTTNPDASGCKPDCPKGVIVYYPDQRSCHKYWGCFNGMAVPQFCPPGMYYNPDLWLCMKPSVAFCTANPNTICQPVTGAQFN